MNTNVVNDNVALLKATCLEVVVEILKHQKGIWKYTTEDVIQEYEKLKQALFISSNS